MLQMSIGLPEGPLKAVVRKLRDFANQQVTPQPGGTKIVNATGEPSQRHERQLHAITSKSVSKGKHIPNDPGEIPYEAVLNSGFVQDTLIPILGEPVGGIRTEKLLPGVAGEYRHGADEILLDERLYTEGFFSNVLAHEMVHGMQDRYLPAAFQGGWVGAGHRRSDDFVPFGSAIGSSDLANQRWDEREAAGGSEAQANALANALEVIRQYQDDNYEDRLAHVQRLTPESGPYSYTEQGATDALDFWYEMLQIPRWRRDRP